MVPLADGPQIGRFIAELRKEKGLTQRALAERLGVTDKAVSKWERDMGYPDVTLLTRLAGCLGVSAGELLNGAREAGPAPAADALVETTLQYADQVSKRRKLGLSKAVLALVTLLGVIAMAVCMICDFSINGTFTWVVYPVSSILFGWLVLAPLLYFQGARVTLALCSASLFLPPFLAVLAHSAGGGWFFPVALPCALAGLAWCWLVWLCYVGFGRSRRVTAGVGVLLLPLVNLTVELALWRFTGFLDLNFWDLLSAIVCALVGGLLIWMGRNR